MKETIPLAPGSAGGLRRDDSPNIDVARARLKFDRPPEAGANGRSAPIVNPIAPGSAGGLIVKGDTPPGGAGG